MDRLGSDDQKSRGIPADMSGDSLIPRPAPGLDEPLEMLAACHERMRAQLATLARLARWLPEHGVDEQAAQAASAVMRYFDLAAVNHHLDEEEDLLPAMLELIPFAEEECLQRRIKRILREHVELAAHWARLRASLMEISEGREAALSEEDIECFAEAYGAHIRFEEEEVLPLAERLLGLDMLEQISSHMIERRRTPV